MCARPPRRAIVRACPVARKGVYVWTAMRADASRIFFLLSVVLRACPCVGLCGACDVCFRALYRLLEIPLLSRYAPCSLSISGETPLARPTSAPPHNSARGPPTLHTRTLIPDLILILTGSMISPPVSLS